uniref:DUF7811 domain-containing protein n=1 Tax=Brassica oleracea var. oleracea TaxID=109376 RepID=A0A0D3EGH0_BRAOL
MVMCSSPHISTWNQFSMEFKTNISTEVHVFHRTGHIDRAVYWTVPHASGKELWLEPWPDDRSDRTGACLSRPTSHFKTYSRARIHFGRAGRSNTYLGELEELSELSDTTLELDELSDTSLELNELSNTEDGAGSAAERNRPFQPKEKFIMGLFLFKFDQPFPQSISSPFSSIIPRGSQQISPGRGYIKRQSKFQSKTLFRQKKHGKSKKLPKFQESPTWILPKGLDMGRRLCIYGLCRSVEMLSDVVEDTVLEYGGEVVAAEKESKGGLQEKLTMTVAVPYLWGVPPTAERLHRADQIGEGIVDKIKERREIVRHQARRTELLLNLSSLTMSLTYDSNGSN